MTASSIVEALGGRGKVAPCPACRKASRDRTGNNLTVAERDGTLLVHCFAGCTQSDVVAALRTRGLWAERERTNWTPSERRAWADTARDRQAADFFGIAARAMCEELVIAIADDDPELCLITGLLTAMRGGDSLAE